MKAFSKGFLRNNPIHSCCHSPKDRDFHPACFKPESPLGRPLCFKSGDARLNHSGMTTLARDPRPAIHVKVHCSSLFFPIPQILIIIFFAFSKCYTPKCFNSVKECFTSVKQLYNLLSIFY